MGKRARRPDALPWSKQREQEKYHLSVLPKGKDGASCFSFSFFVFVCFSFSFFFPIIGTRGRKALCARKQLAQGPSLSYPILIIPMQKIGRADFGHRPLVSPIDGVRGHERNRRSPFGRETVKQVFCDRQDDGFSGAMLPFPLFVPEGDRPLTRSNELGRSQVTRCRLFEGRNEERQQTHTFVDERKDTLPEGRVLVDLHKQVHAYVFW
mmetsp:Transcript_39922/g.102985  ORF Transcript_39922/g.102985 Transcript_39922/m.102985 type:complete len:209 (+) Transcript_39922:1724-2350(+)